MESVMDGAEKVTLSTVWYGDCRNSTTELPTDRLFTGQRYDDTGLYYYGARYYDPEIGRFISPDTIIPNPTNPQSFNRYSYCLNNPLKYVDPSGHTCNANGVNTKTYFDPRLVMVNGGGSVAAAGSSEAGQAHEAARSSDPDWIASLEKSDTVYDVIPLPVESTSTTQTVKYESEYITYTKQIQPVHVAAPKVNDDWYINLNIQYGEYGVITGGIMLNDKGVYPYLGGGGGGSLLPISSTLSVSNSNPISGLNVEFQGNVIFGWNWGFAFDFNDPELGWNVSDYHEYSIGIPSFSGTLYWVWEITWDEIFQ